MSSNQATKPAKSSSTNWTGAFFTIAMIVLGVALYIFARSAGTILPGYQGVFTAAAVVIMAFGLLLGHIALLIAACHDALRARHSQREASAPSDQPQD